jgi:hypothetical protein
MGLSSVCQVLVCLSESEVVSTQNREEVEEAPDYKLPNLDLATLHHLNATVYRRRQVPARGRCRLRHRESNTPTFHLLTRDARD